MSAPRRILPIIDLARPSRIRKRNAIATRRLVLVENFSRGASAMSLIWVALKTVRQNPLYDNTGRLKMRE